MPYAEKSSKSEYDKKRYSEMKELYKNRANKFYEDNKCKILERRKLHYYANRNKIITRVKAYRNNNLSKIKLRKSEYYKKVTRLRLNNEPTLRIKWRLRKRIWSAIRKQKGYKLKPTLELLGCNDIDFVRKYLESKFKDGMTWQNYGIWHIDHIQPLSKFNLLKLEQQKIAFNYKNLQPLWAIDNLKKGDRTESSETLR